MHLTSTALSVVPPLTSYLSWRALETGQVPAEQVLARAARPDFAFFSDPIIPMRLTPWRGLVSSLFVFLLYSEALPFMANASS